MAIAGGRPSKRWTTDDVERLLDAGVIEHLERYTLISGEIRARPLQKLPHISGVIAMTEALRALFGPAGCYVSTQSPIKGDPASEP